ncbi:MAG: prepilin peptidase [Peptococcaceae bacterium]|nr:prepilin peptidase [Peptococcaceae bacterium]
MDTLFLALMLIWAAWRDLRDRVIPDAVPVGLTVYVLAGAILGVIPGVGAALLGLALGAGVLLFASFFGTMGGGDIKLMGALGAWFGLRIVDVLLLSSVLGVVLMLIYSFKYRKWYSEIPLAPAIAVAALAVWLCT